MAAEANSSVRPIVCGGKGFFQFVAEHADATLHHALGGKRGADGTIKSSPIAGTMV